MSAREPCPDGRPNAPESATQRRMWRLPGMPRTLHHWTFIVGVLAGLAAVVDSLLDHDPEQAFWAFISAGWAFAGYDAIRQAERREGS